MVSYHSKLWRVVSSFGCPQFLLLPNVLDENWLIRAGSHYRRFSRNLFTLETESVNTPSFLIRPLICEFSKISKSWKKKHQRRLCASVGQTNFSKSRKIKGARCQSCQQLKKVTPNIDDKVSKVKKRAKFHHLHWRFHCVRFEVTAWTGEIFPFLTTAIKCQEVRSISSFRTWATPAPSIWSDVSAEQRRVIVTLSWLNKISPLKFPLCDWRLHFHSLKCDRISSILFLFPVWCSLIFQPDFFKPKRKLVRNATRP